MQTHIEITIPIRNEEEAALLIASLSTHGFEGFLEEQQALKAYIPLPNYDRSGLESICKNFAVTYQEQPIVPKNWNEEWESNFQPVLIDDFVSVRASFHPKKELVLYDIIINPKMSFGTGHHATTHLMIAEMKTISFEQKVVLDFGTGTGVLAILAKKMGAPSVMAIDNDAWSIENAQENFKENCTEEIILQESNVPPADILFDVIIANINKSILLRYLFSFFNSLTTNGILLLSGILEEDLPEIIQSAQAVGFTYQHSKQKEGWMLVRFFKK